jgi:GMP synthase PP-ATPase subunit
MPVSSEHDAKIDSIFIYDEDLYNYDLKFLSQGSYFSDLVEQPSTRKKKVKASINASK